MASGGYDGQIKIDSSINSKGFNQGIKGMTALASKLGVALAAAFAVIVVVNFTVSVAKLSAEFQRLGIAAQAVGQLQGMAASETRALTDELINSGIQTDTANRAYINFARNGLDTVLLPALARGAQDLNVFSEAGETSSDVLDRLTTGVLNLNSLMLRRAGIAVDVLASEKAYGEAIGKTTQQMTTQEKRQGVLIAVTREMQKVQGLYELSQKTAAGQMASNTRVTNEFKAALGAPLQNAFYTLIKAWNTLLKTMTRSITEGGMFYGVMIKIGTVVAFVAQMVAKLFYAIASLFGYVPPVAQGISDIGEAAGGVSDAADGIGDLTDATNEAGEAAKGALAPFDDLNVLAQDTGAGGGSGDVGGGVGDLGLGAINPDDFIFPMDEIKAKVEEMNAAFEKSWFGAKLFPAIGRLFEAAGNLIGVAIEKLTPYWDWFVENILAPVGDFAGTLIVGALDTITWALDEMTKKLEDGDATFWVIIATIGVFALTLAILGAPIWLIVLAIIAVIAIIKNWDAITTWFGKQWETFTTWLGKGWDAFVDGFHDTLNNMKNWTKGIVNNIIDYLNGMIAGVTDGINAVIFSANAIASSVGLPTINFVQTAKIPHLATGAVIPPNAEFAAVLGDQKSGRNIEAPESLIRQIVAEEIGNIKADINISFDGSLGALVRELKPRIDKENVRIGNSLISSGVTA